MQLTLLCPSKGMKFFPISSLPVVSSNTKAYLSHEPSIQGRNTHISALPDKPFFQVASSSLHPQCNQEAVGKATQLSAQQRSPSVSLAHCSSSVGLFSFTSVSTISWGLGKPGQQLQPFCRKGHLLLSYQLRDDVQPLRKADIIPSMWHLHSTLQCSYVNVRQLGDIIQVLSTHLKPRG